MPDSTPSRAVVLAIFLIALATAASAQTWNLAWSDEFNGGLNSAIDAATWKYDTGILNVNNEAEYYCAPGSNTAPCDASNPNAYIDGSGHLILQAIRINSSVEPYSGSWTSARLKSQDLRSFQYGRIESSMTLPLGPGLWPAFWALGSNITTVGWPASGEIDYMENVPASSGLGPTVIQSTIHGGTSSSNYGPGKAYTLTNSSDVTSFHTYGAIWSPNMVQFYVDDPANVFFVQTSSDIPSGLSWDFNAPFFQLLNLAVGGTGSWPGVPDNTTPSPALMAVDYVRVYTPSPIAGPAITAGSISVKAGQTGASSVTLNSTAGTGRVFLSCSTNAPKATCSITSADPLNKYTVDFTSNASAAAIVSVTTTANTVAASGAPTTRPRLWAALAGMVALGVSLMLPLIPLSRSRRQLLAAAGMLLILVPFPACGGGTNGGGGGGGGSNGTPPGSYSVTVNAYTLSNTTGTPDSTAGISLNVN